MNITQKIGFLFISSTLLYLKILKLSLITYFVLEIVTLGIFVCLVVLYEALSINSCENEYKEYKERQKRFRYNVE